ncbi:SPRTN [Mytilus edulis]|uniref:SPRTN n=1 Tax=Mytilus edulis TaxID=6550 RepID=A0A8S3PV75_MYTED|nr:SPRTN [Mytilus edulis]
MVDRYGRSPDIYLPFPIDHERIGTQRREKLQREIEKMEQDQRQRQHLIEELSKMAETKKQNQQDRLLVKYNKKNLLSDEMMRVYGKETASKIGRMSVEPKLVNNVVSQRTKEYAVRQQEMEMEAKYLVKERQRLQDARERVHEQRRFLAKSSSPSASVMSEPTTCRTEPEVQDTSRLSLQTPTFRHWFTSLEQSISIKKNKMNFIDDDFLLALELQEQLDRDSWQPSQSASKPGANLSIVDESWETIDPNPDIRELFLQFNEEFFWGRLAGIEVKWSPRMTLCAGLCCYERRGGLCSVRLSSPLLKLRPRRDLVETLLHEMIHAYLFITDNNKDHDGHGPEFHKHMYRINDATGTKISVSIDM